LEFFEGSGDGAFEAGVVAPEVREHAGVGEVGAHGVGHFGVGADVLEVRFDAFGLFAPLEVLEADFGGLDAAAAPDGGDDVVDQVDLGWGFGLIFLAEGG
jgi:hypothetical protein